ncbi:MAG: hypothetical protein FJX95_00875 [Bacteroidetes bacterium]|nr:hypothetical protein [Bacteroidota bacterium]
MKRWMTFLGLMLMISMSCNRCKDGQLYPQVNFGFTININEPAYFDLTVPSGWLYYDGGTVKLIVYRNTLEEFTIYDARSTYNPESPCICTVSSDNTFIEDPCSDSQWLLTDGSVVHGPAGQNLLTYDYSFDSATGVLYFYN